MGNHLDCASVIHRHVELDRPEGIYSANEVVSGTVSNLRARNASIVLTGVIHLQKKNKKSVERHQIQFFSGESALQSSSDGQYSFQLQLREGLPPSFHRLATFPNVFYSIDLIDAASKKRLGRSVPIRVCPRVQIDQPLLRAPLYFGPVGNHVTGMKLEVKLNRAVFTFDDLIHLYYELQNPSEVYVHRMQVSLGVYYSAESNVWQEDVSSGMENLPMHGWTNKLRRNKVVLSIPEKIHLPPTFDYKHGHEGESTAFHLKIEYKIQFQVYLTEQEDLWQVDVPIVLCHDLIDDQPLAVEASPWIESMNVSQRTIGGHDFFFLEKTNLTPSGCIRYHIEATIWMIAEFENRKQTN